MEAEKAALIAELQGRFAHLSAEEIERKLRQFLKRWINRKMIGPFRTWKGIIEAKRQAEMDALLEAERARLAAELAAMQDNMAIKKLKMHFSKIAGLAKEQTFKALAVHCRQSKAKKLLDSEAGKRLKAFLAQKLAGTMRKCYTAIIRNHDQIAAENIKNNDKAKKVALMLEKIARGIVHRCFNAFVRYWQEAAEERAAQDAINARLSLLDEANRAKLRVFLMGKEKQKMMLFFKQWVEVAQQKGLLELYEMLDKEEAARKAAEAELERLLSESGAAGGALKSMEDEIAAEQAELSKINASCKGLGGELRRLQKQITNTEADMESEQCLRQEQQEKNYVLREQLAEVTAVRDDLAAQLMGVAGDVETVHGEATH
jgi:Skp family chaperone for outer membrane proteins